MFHELLGGFIQHGPSWEIGSTSDAGESSIDQLVQLAIDRNSANGLDICLGDGLPIGNESEGFESGSAQLLGSHFGQKSPDPFGVVGPGHELPAVDAFLQLNGLSLAGKSFAQLCDVGLDFLGGNVVPFPGFRGIAFVGATTNRLRNFSGGDRFGSGKYHCLDDLDQIHERRSFWEVGKLA